MIFDNLSDFFLPREVPIKLYLYRTYTYVTYIFDRGQRRASQGPPAHEDGGGREATNVLLAAAPQRHTTAASSRSHHCVRA